MRSMDSYWKAAMERAMKIQEVLGGRWRGKSHGFKQPQSVPPQTAATEIEAIRDAIAEERGELLDPTFRKALLVAVVIALASQFTGINTVIYYGSSVFLEHVPHQTASTALSANVILGAVQFCGHYRGNATH